MWCFSPGGGCFLFKFFIVTVMGVMPLPLERAISLNQFDAEGLNRKNVKYTKFILRLKFPL